MKRNKFEGLFKKFVIVVICIFLSTSAFAIKKYTITDVGIFGGDNSSAKAINNKGQVVEIQ